MPKWEGRKSRNIIDLRDTPVNSQELFDYALLGNVSPAVAAHIENHAKQQALRAGGEKQAVQMLEELRLKQKLSVALKNHYAARRAKK